MIKKSLFPFDRHTAHGTCAKNTVNTYIILNIYMRAVYETYILKLFKSLETLRLYRYILHHYIMHLPRDLRYTVCSLL